jgi:MFS family permease
LISGAPEPAVSPEEEALRHAADREASMAMAKAARRLLWGRGLRGFVDGLVSVLLAGYLIRLGFTAAMVGVLVTGTLLGSGALTLAVGLIAHRFRTRSLLVGAAALMAATGLGFATFESFWPLWVVAVLGTLNPSSGDVSMFLPLEQAALAAGAATSSDRTALLARYNVAGALAGALGALAAGLPAMLAGLWGVGLSAAERSVFLVYAAVGAVIAWVYRKLPSTAVAPKGRMPLARSRSRVLALAFLFSLDSFGGGFVVQSLLALWLFRRFDLSLQAAGAFFFVSNTLGALSQLLSPKLAARIGLVRTMVYTHVPANLFLMTAAFMPNLGLCVLCLLLRASVSSMDVPARQAYVMSVVPPDERAAASSVTNVPRSLASALSPLLTGIMLERSSFGWPLVCAGVLKIAYDFLLLFQFRSVSPEGDA